MATPLSLSRACEGLIRYKQAAQKSEHTISDYRNSFSKLRLYFKDDPAFASLTRDKLVGFFAWLRTDYESEPDGVAPRGKKKLSAKSVLNIHTNLSALWAWGVQEGYVKENFIRRIERPVVTNPVVEPLTREEISALLKATDTSRSWKTREHTSNIRPTAVRDRAIIMALVDTGVRASELCGITYADMNFDHNSIRVRGKGPGGEGKERIVYFGKGSARQLWKYLLPRLDTIRPEDPVFTAGSDVYSRPMSRGALLKLLYSISRKAGVSKVHPHRFRHTFAINYLRNHGDVFTLQSLLGHEDLEMVKRYARIAQADVAETHRRASPVDNWRLV